MATSTAVVTTLMQQFQIIFVTILLIILNLILLFPIFLVLTFRKFLSVFSSALKLQKILTSSATIFGVDDIYTVPKVNVIIILQISGHLTLEKVTRLFQAGVLERLDPGGRQSFYPELKWYIFPCLGFVFWKKDTQFNLSNHIRYYEEQTGTITSDYQTKEPAVILNKVRESLAHRTWAPKKSPWELLLLDLPDDKVNTGKSRKQTALIFRAHHALADGIGLFSLLCQDLAGNPVLREASAQIIPKSWAKSRNAAAYLTLPFKLHYIFSRQMITCNDQNSWKVPEHHLSRKVRSCVSRKFPMEDVKRIAKSHSTNAASVLLAMISGALRSCMIRSGENVPEAMHGIMPIPARIDHGGKLRNYISYVYPMLATGSSSCLERLKICDISYKRCKNSSDPIVNAVIHKLAGSTCRPIVHAFQKNVYATILLSNFPGPTQQLFFDGHQITDMNFSTATHGFGGISIAILSYNGNFTFTITFDDAIPTKDADPAERVCEYLETEFYQLKQSITGEDTV